MISLGVATATTVDGFQQQADQFTSQIQTLIRHPREQECKATLSRLWPMTYDAFPYKILKATMDYAC